MPKQSYLALGGFLCAVTLASGCGEKKSSGDSKASKPPASMPAAAQTKKDQKNGVVPVRLPGELVPAPWLAEATRVAALGEGENAIILAAGPGWLRWFKPTGERLGERLEAGAPQVLRVVDLGEDGTEEVLFARGMGRDAADAKRVLEVLRIDGKNIESEVIDLPETTRQQIAGVAKAKGTKAAVWVAAFANKYEVEVSLYEKGETGWSKTQDRGRHRVVSDLVVLDSGVPVIARMYGDSADEPGGIYELPETAAPVQIPSIRGARALALLPGRDQVVMADGWHKNYGRRAQGLISIAGRKSWGWTKLSSAELAGNYGFSELAVGNLHREEGPEIIAAGNGLAVVALPGRPDLLYTIGDSDAVDVALVNLHGDQRDEVVIAGPKPAIWSPR